MGAAHPHLLLRQAGGQAAGGRRERPRAHAVLPGLALCTQRALLRGRQLRARRLCAAPATPTVVKAPPLCSAGASQGKRHWPGRSSSLARAASRHATAASRHCGAAHPAPR